MIWFNQPLRSCIDEEAQKGEVTFLKSHSQWVAELEPEIKCPNSQPGHLAGSYHFLVFPQTWAHTLAGSSICVCQVTDWPLNLASSLQKSWLGVKKKKS